MGKHQVSLKSSLLQSGEYLYTIKASYYEKTRNCYQSMMKPITYEKNNLHQFAVVTKCINNSLTQFNHLQLDFQAQLI